MTPSSTTPPSATAPRVAPAVDLLSQLTIRPVRPRDDALVVHRWVTHPKSVFWQMQDADVPAVLRYLETLDGAQGHDAYLGLHEGRPAFLAERYDPTRSPLAGRYPWQPGDVGMHFLVAPTDHPLRGFTRAVLVTVMDLVLSDPAARRVVVEPDVRNTAVQALNASVGFDVVGEVPLPDKVALLSVATREQYLRARDARPAAAEGTTR